MSTKEIESKVTELKELQRMQEDLTAEIDAIKDPIRAALGEREDVTAGADKITHKEVTSNRLDSAALKKALPEIAAQFTKQTTARRFSIN